MKTGIIASIHADFFGLRLVDPEMADSYETVVAVEAHFQNLKQYTEWLAVINYYRQAFLKSKARCKASIVQGTSFPTSMRPLVNLLLKCVQHQCVETKYVIL